LFEIIKMMLALSYHQLIICSCKIDAACLGWKLTSLSIVFIISFTRYQLL
jgi:hypothetical protein